MKTKLYLTNFQQLINPRLETLTEQKIIPRIWGKDYTVWKPNPDEITNRLGWLNIIEDMFKEVEQIENLVEQASRDGFTTILVLGMGGSSLAPELFSKIFSQDSQKFKVHVLDTTDPDAILACKQQLKINKTLFIVASKSGKTVETLSLFKYYYNVIQKLNLKKHAGEHFVAITDPGSPLVEVAEHYHFRHIFLNNPNIGGRYSALSCYGLVPAAFAGINLHRLLENAKQMANLLKTEKPLEQNPAALLGAILGELSEHGLDKITFLLDSKIESFGDWVEQLIAESTGKEGKGIIPIVQEAIGKPDTYSEDRIFVFIGFTNTAFSESINALFHKGHPVIQLTIENNYDIGGLFFLWEFVVAVAGHILQINPFNQPNVESAKILARQKIKEFQEKGQLPTTKSHPISPSKFKDFLSTTKPGEYIAIQAFVQPTNDVKNSLNLLRTALRDKYKVATTLGFGPRFLHSTGQLHKGGKPNGKFIQITSSPTNDLPIPDEAGTDKSSISFGTLKLAQALGDAEALQQSKRQVLCFHTENSRLDELNRLIDFI